jgi:RNA polymerase sigma factor (sigma-70 family)
MIDDDLVVRARSDRSAFAALYDQYYPRVLRYCVRRLSVRQAAEDATSEVFLQIAAHLPGFAGTTETDFRRWLFRIATNAVSAQLRQVRRRHELWHSAAQNGALRAADSAASTPPVEILDWPALHEAILELEPRDQTIVTLRFYADLPHDEIAGIVGASAGTVRTALSRILNRLRTRFGVDKTATNVPKGEP